MSIAYIFPGQGSQYVGMGKDLVEHNEFARDMFRMADQILGVSLSKICFEGPEEELKQTRNTHRRSSYTVLRSHGFSIPMSRPS